jgi:hypothetical protein
VAEISDHPISAACLAPVQAAALLDLVSKSQYASGHIGIGDDMVTSNENNRVRKKAPAESSTGASLERC